MCRSRREFSNADLLAKVVFDTAENEPCKVCPIERCSRGREVAERTAAIDRALGERTAVEDVREIVREHTDDKVRF